jgi:hypothetical protein
LRYFFFLKSYRNAYYLLASITITYDFTEVLSYSTSGCSSEDSSSIDFYRTLAAFSESEERSASIWGLSGSGSGSSMI